VDGAREHKLPVISELHYFLHCYSAELFAIKCLDIGRIGRRWSLFVHEKTGCPKDSKRFMDVKKGSRFIHERFESMGKSFHLDRVSVTSWKRGPLSLEGCGLIAAEWRPPPYTLTSFC